MLLKKLSLKGMMKHSYKILSILVVATLIFLFIFFTRRHLGQDRIVVRAYLTNVDALNKSAGSLFIRFYYFVENRKYSDYQAFPCSRNKADAIRGVLVGDHFVQVVCEISNPSNCIILLNRKQYKENKLEVPEEAGNVIDSIFDLCNGKS